MSGQTETRLRSIIESSSGLHLTIYAQNRGSAELLQKDLWELVDSSRDFLTPVLPPHLEREFLNPIREITHNPRILSSFEENIAIFRTPHSLRILSIPVPVESMTVVATTFHVKPLLRWLQTERTYLFAGFTKNSVHLFKGTNYKFEKVDELALDDFEVDVAGWILNWMNSEEFSSKTRIFLAGSPARVEPLKDILNGSLNYSTTAFGLFYARKPDAHLEQINMRFAQEANDIIDSALSEYFVAEELRLAKKNIFEIAKAAVRGRVRKLIIADGVQIFGKINRETGELRINPFDLDHEDDDVLDDLAQIVLSKGGQVIVADRSQIPKGRSVLAITAPRKSTIPVRPLKQTSVNSLSLASMR